MKGVFGELAMKKPVKEGILMRDIRYQSEAT